MQSPLLEGYLGIAKEDDGEPRRRYFVLRPDALQHFRDQEAYAGGQEPKSVSLDEIDTVALEDRGLRIVLRGGQAMLFSELDEGDAARWAEAIGAARPGGGKEVMHEGELALTVCGKKATYHVVLYSDSLQYFSTQAALESGMPDGSFSLQEVDDLEVEDTFFLMHMADGSEVLLEETAGGGLQGWVDAFSQAFEGEMDEPVGGTPVAAPPGVKEPLHAKEPEGRPAGGHVHSGVLHLAVGPGSEVPRFVVLHGNRIDLFETQADYSQSRPPLTSICDEDVTRVNVHDNAFVIGAGGHQLDLRVPQGESVEAWVSALRGMLDASGEDGYLTPSTEASPTTYEGGEARAAALPLEEEARNPHVVSWLESLASEGLSMKGVLWLSRERRLVPKFAALLRTHVDFWASPLGAADGQPPDVRILLSEVYGLAVVGGGFVLDHKGRKMGIHAGEAPYLQEWKAALQAALSLEGGSAPRSPGLKSDDGGQDPARQPGWIPRVALMKSPRQARSDQDGGSPRKNGGKALPQRKNGVPFRSGTAAQLAAARRQACRRDPDGPHASSAVKSYQESAQLSAKLHSSARNRNFSPRSPLEPDAFTHRAPEWSQGIAAQITGKINQRAVPLAAKPERTTALADKVSGPRVMAAPGGEPKVATKITGATRAVSPRCGRGEEPLSPKVHEADRVPLRRRSPAGKGVVLWQPAPSPAA